MWLKVVLYNKLYIRSDFAWQVNVNQEKFVFFQLPALFERISIESFVYNILFVRAPVFNFESSTIQFSIVNSSLLL
jgi:hypothetical protein